MTRSPRERPGLGLLIALAAPALVALLVVGLETAQALSLSYMPLLAVVMLAAWIGGLYPGLLATATSAALQLALVLRDDLLLGADGVRLVLFILVASLISLLTGRLHRTQRRAQHQAMLLDQASDAIFTWSPGGAIDYWNRGAERLYGYLAREAVGRPAHELLHTRSDEPMEAILAHLERGVTWTGELRQRTRAGEEVVVRSSMVPVDQDGRRLVVETHRDATAQRQAERECADALETLKARETHFREVFARAPVGMVVTSRNGRFIEANEAYCSIIGYSQEELRDLDFLSLTHPDDAPRNREEYHRLLSGEIPAFHVEKRYRRKDGTTVWVRASASLRREPDGEVQLVGLVEDISARKHAEQALRESEERFRLAAEAVDGVIYDHDVATGRVERTRGVQAVLGYVQEEVEPHVQWWLDRVHPDDLEPMRRRFEQAAASGGDRSVVEYRMRHRDGRWLHVEDRSVLIRDGSGRVVREVGCTLDISKEHRAQAALRQSETRLRLALAAGRFYTWDYDPQTQVSHWEDGLYRVHGLTPHPTGIAQHEVEDLVHPEDRERVRVEFANAMGRGSAFAIEFRIIPVGGHERWLSSFGNFLLKEDGGIDRAVGVSQDITERKRNEEALREADRRKDEFLATLAHELRNPLAPMRNAVQILRLARDEPAAVDRSLAMLERQLGQLVHLIDDLLDISRIARGKLKLRRERVDLASVINAAVETSRPAIESNRHRLSLDLPPEPVLVDGDLARLSQVFANLLNNAARYTPPGGRIRIGVQQEDGSAVVRIQDNGIGIPSEAMPRLFEMFAQGEEGPGGGLGIGLALVRGITEMHGGRVEAISRGRGEGSEFVVRLPLLDSVPQQLKDAAEAAPLPPTQERMRVLVADDNFDAASSLAMLLELYGHEVRVAHDGAEAVEAAEAFRPELVFMDLGMPRLDGLEATRRIRERDWGRRVVIYALTGWGQERDRQRSREAGCNGHLVKPLQPEELDRVLGRLRAA